MAFARLIKFLRDSIEYVWFVLVPPRYTIRGSRAMTSKQVRIYPNSFGGFFVELFEDDSFVGNEDLNAETEEEARAESLERFNVAPHNLRIMRPNPAEEESDGYELS